MRMYSENIAAHMAKLHEIDIGGEGALQTTLMQHLWQWISKGKMISL